MIHVLAILATWRLTNMLYAESGPFDMFDHFRTFLCRWDMPKKMLKCDLCCSVWVAGLIGLLWLGGVYVHQLFYWPIYVLGWSGTVCLIRIGMDMGWRVIHSIEKGEKTMPIDPFEESGRFAGQEIEPESEEEPAARPLEVQNWHEQFGKAGLDLSDLTPPEEYLEDGNATGK